MASQIARLIGGPGTGKTSELLSIMGKVIDRGIDPFEIGFCSFTRAARAEAADRVEKLFGVSSDKLQKTGWFRTVHSTCHRQLGKSVTAGLLTGTKEDNEWLSGAVGSPCSMERASGAADNKVSDVDEGPELTSHGSRAIRMWTVARNRLCSVREVWEEERACGTDPPSEEFCIQIISSYESAKFRDGRCDFTDLIGKFAGWQWIPSGKPEPAAPLGETPECQVWFFDEHQDASRLIHSAAMRLANSPSCVFSYVSGDPFQALYEWAGGDHTCMLGGLDDVLSKSRTMHQSWRCPPDVMALGERVLKGCSDYFDRQIKPADKTGGIFRHNSIRDILESGKLHEGWIMQARTNYLASRIGRALTSHCVPWSFEKGSGGYLKPTVRSICAAMVDLEHGKQIEKQQWVAIVKKLQTGSGDTALFRRGLKASVASGDAGFPDTIGRENLIQCGATEYLAERIASGSWVQLVEDAQVFREVEAKFGRELAMTPKIRVGTNHAFKGSEAENVLILTSLTKQVERGMQTKSGADAERRVAYVGVTRSMRDLHVLTQSRDRFRFDI